MKLEEMVRNIVSGAVDNYLSEASGPVCGTGSTAALCKVPAEASGRHVHLSQEDVERLFGAGYELTPKRPLSQPGQFLSEERVTLIGPKDTFRNVAVLGPARRHTQVEISATDARELGLHPPVALSGDLSRAGDMLIASKDAFLMAEQSLIIAKNHVHMSAEEAAAVGLRDGDRVDVYMCTSRPVTFHDVVVRSGPGHKLALHIDFDEANACGWEPGSEAVLYGSCGESACPAAETCPPEAETALTGPGDVLVSTGFLTELQVKDALASGATAIVVSEKTVVSPLANDLMHRNHVELKRM